MNNVITFDYDQSVKKAKGLYLSWKTVTVDFLAELYRARKELNAQGTNQYSIVPNGTKQKTWANYLDDIGIPRRTAHNWLERYLPDENKVLTLEEFKERKQLEFKQKQEQEIKQRSKIQYRIKYNKKPEEWTKADDKEWEKYLKEERERDERIAAAQREAEKEQKENNEKKNFDYTNLINEAMAYEKEKTRIIESTRGNEDVIYIILGVLEKLKTDNDRLEFCNTLIKFLRKKAVEYNQNSVKPKE